MPNKLSIALLFNLILAIGLPVEGMAQKAIGVEWSVPNNNGQALQQLDSFEQLGVDYLLIDTTLNEPVWQRVDSLQFTVFADLPVNYPVAHTFTDADSTLIDEISSRLNHYATKPSVRAVGLFRFGQINNSNFDEALEPTIQEISTTLSVDVYYTTTKSDIVEIDNLVSFKLIADNGLSSDEQVPQNNIGGYLYTPVQPDTLLGPVKNLLAKADRDSVPVFFKSGWLQQMTDSSPELRSSLQYYINTSELVFPIPQEPSPNSPSHSGIVILLLVIWGLFVLNYHFNPIYQKASSRYFSAHKFLVVDIMKRHIRTITPAVIILIQHILASGIAAYCLGVVLFTGNGLNALLHHFPDIFLLGSPLLSLFLWGCLISFLCHFVSIIWIGILNKDVKHTSQILLLYSWPLQINFVVITLMVTLAMSVSWAGIFYLLTVIFALIFLSAFVVAAFDTTKHSSDSKTLFLVSSVGIYSILVAGLALWFFSNEYLLEVLNLAANLN